MKPETLRSLEISNKDKRVFGNFMYGFQKWLANDQAAVKYFSQVKNFGASVVEFWLPDDRAVRLCVVSRISPNNFRCQFKKIEWVTQESGATLREWVTIADDVILKVIDDNNFLVFIEGVVVQDPSQNYDELIDYLMRIIPNSY